jgi:VWFA-related protein
MRSNAVLSLLTLALTLPILAQQAPATPAPATQTSPETPPPAPNAANTIHSSAQLVILDGVAVDAKGVPVTDLTQADFHLVDDDQPQKIRNFDPPGRFTPTPDLTIDSTADLDRLAPRAPVNIVLLDEFTTHFADMAFARYSLKKWLEKQPAKLDTPTMLAAVDFEHFTVLRDYTQNKDEILQALDHHFIANPWRNGNFSWVNEQYATAFNTLRRIAEASAGHQGHKNMIWLGRGLPTINLSNFSVDNQRKTNTAVQLAVDELRDARVTLYTIDPSGLTVEPGGGYGNDARLFAPFGGDPTFEALARETGGRTFHGTNDVDVQVGDSIRDGSSLYTLSYTPSNPSTDVNKFRRIKVTIDRPGITFVTRQGYYPSIRPARLYPGGQAGQRLMSELFDAASSNMVYDAVDFTVAASSTDPNDFRIVVLGPSMDWYVTHDPDKPRFTRVILIATTLDKKGKELNKDGRTYSFTAPLAAPANGRLHIPIAVDFKLKPDPKAVRVRFVTRVEASGHMGTADLTLTPGATARSTGIEPTPSTASAPQTHTP